MGPEVSTIIADTFFEKKNIYRKTSR